MRGSIRLPLGKDKYFVVYGGRYLDRPKQFHGVKMAAEINSPCTIDIPTKDYSTPDRKDVVAGLKKATNLITHGGEVYVGCMGGIGRTGLFLAILAKAFGIENPIQYVRLHYYPDAVETIRQKEYIRDFRIPLSVRWQILMARFRYRSWAGKITGYDQSVETHVA